MPWPGVGLTPLWSQESVEQDRVNVRTQKWNKNGLGVSWSV